MPAGAAWALLVGVSLIYTALGTRARLADRFQVGPLTLDGAAYMQRAVHQEQGQPVAGTQGAAMPAIQAAVSFVQSAMKVLHRNDPSFWAKR